MLPPYDQHPQIVNLEPECIVATITRVLRRCYTSSPWANLPIMAHVWLLLIKGGLEESLAFSFLTPDTIASLMYASM